MKRGRTKREANFDHNLVRRIILGLLNGCAYFDCRAAHAEGTVTDSEYDAVAKSYMNGKVTDPDMIQDIGIWLYNRIGEGAVEALPIITNCSVEEATSLVNRLQEHISILEDIAEYIDLQGGSLSAQEVASGMQMDLDEVKLYLEAAVTADIVARDGQKYSTDKTTIGAALARLIAQGKVERFIDPKTGKAAYRAIPKQ